MNEEKPVENRYRALLRAIPGPIDREEMARIRRAMNLLVEMRSSQVTITGESAVEHALSVARIVVSEMGLGVTSIIGALLHDCAANIPFGREEVESRFGTGTFPVIEGLGKLESIEASSSSYQAENFLKLVLSLADDIRVILIKLVERLEYMRLLDGAEPARQLMVASESYFLYAPLAHRLGLYTSSRRWRTWLETRSGCLQAYR
ncbi:MAG: HD domain-containing protein [Bacteroidales bacterium]